MHTRTLSILKPTNEWLVHTCEVLVLVLVLLSFPYSYNHNYHINYHYVATQA